MAMLTSRATVFVGSSTPALPIAKEVKDGLAQVANVVAWDTAFDAGTWLLGGILNQAQQSDFAVFVIRDDDTVTIKEEKYTTVRDNVLFEAGVFMGAIGPERTFLLWPSVPGKKLLRLPTDLEGLLRVTYTPASTSKGKPKLASALTAIRDRIVSMGPALRSGYNEIAALKQALHERDIEYANGVDSLKEVVERAARRRDRPWFSATSVETLTDAIWEEYVHDIVDTVFWWLVVYGVITFDNIDQWSEGIWDYEESLDYAVFTNRGVALLNELRSSG